MTRGEGNNNNNNEEDVFGRRNCSIGWRVHLASELGEKGWGAHTGTTNAHEDFQIRRRPARVLAAAVGAVLVLWPLEHVLQLLDVAIERLLALLLHQRGRHVRRGEKELF